MTKAVDAKVGDKETCKSCGTEVTCGLTKGTPEYPSKNQWQVDGKAHYNYDHQTKTTACNNVIIEDPKNKATQNHSGNTVQYSPEIVRQESFTEFDKIYSEGWIKAKTLIETLTFPTKPVGKDLEIMLQCIMKAYVHFYIARNLK
jgi:hypothetical protein